MFLVCPKNLQKDSCGLVDLPKFRDLTLEILDSLVDSLLTGGWKETFKNKVDSNAFYGIQLEVRSRRSNSHNQYVLERRSFDAMRLEIIQALRNFLEEQLRLEDDLGDVLNSLSTDKISQLSDEQIRLVQHQS